MTGCSNKLATDRGAPPTFSEVFPSVLDEASRAEKARQIMRLIRGFREAPYEALKCLDIGCSGGIITRCLAQHFGLIVGVDMDAMALAVARKHKDARFAAADAMRLPFGDASFDVVICNHVYEHVPDSATLFEEVFRILKPNGFCYLSDGNKYVLMEAHYRLPFLSWLPQRLADRYIRAFGKAPYYDVNLLSHWQLRGRVSQFVVHDLTAQAVQEYEPGPSRMARLAKAMACALPSWCDRILQVASPTMIWILCKTKR